MKAGVLISMCVLCLALCSCQADIQVKTRYDLKPHIEASQAVIVFDIGLNQGSAFRETFAQTLGELARNGERKITIMSFIQYVNSPYNQPENKGKFVDCVFVFMRTVETRGSGGLIEEHYVIEADYIDQDGFYVSEIFFRTYPPFGWSKPDVRRLAQTVYVELREHQLL